MLDADQVLCYPSAKRSRWNGRLLAETGRQRGAGAVEGERPADGAGKSEKALIADDDALVRSSAAEMLRELGYGVDEASSAREALTLFRKGLRPNLLVTDHLMPA